MSKLLANPPLVEVVCEFRFAEGKSWDWLTPCLLYEQLKDRFPLRTSIQAPEVTFAIEGGQIRHAGNESRLERVAMSSEDRTAQVQLGPDRLVVNHMQPYPGWDTYVELIIDVVDAYVRVSEAGAISRIGLRYVNELAIAGGHENELGQISIGSVITLDPPIPEEIETPLSLFHQRYVLNHGDIDSFLVHQTVLQASVDPQNPPNIILDLDFYTQAIQEYEIDRIRGWLTTAHERVSAAFSASVNAELLANMEGGAVDGSSEEPIT